MSDQWVKFWQAMAWMAVAMAIVSLTTCGERVAHALGSLDIVDTLENHDKLAGWAQFVGAMIALWVTGWFAWGQSRQIVLREEQQLKNFALLALFVRSGLRDVIETIEGERQGSPIITADVVREGLDSTEALLRLQAPTIPSSFMMNNFYALLSHISQLRTAYQLVADGKGQMQHLRSSLKAIDVICFNIGQETKRLGGKCRPHDDRQLSEFLNVPISTKFYWWRQEHRWRSHRDRTH